MPRRVIQKCGTEIESKEKRVFAANESKLSMDEEAELALMLNVQTLMTRTQVTPHIEEITLGFDYLTAQECLRDFPSCLRISVICFKDEYRFLDTLSVNVELKYRKRRSLLCETGLYRETSLSYVSF